jgi:hypothetical protein
VNALARERLIRRKAKESRYRAPLLRSIWVTLRESAISAYLGLRDRRDTRRALRWWSTRCDLERTRSVTSWRRTARFVGYANADDHGMTLDAALAAITAKADSYFDTTGILTQPVKPEEKHETIGK